MKNRVINLGLILAVFALGAFLSCVEDDGGNTGENGNKGTHPVIDMVQIPAGTLTKDSTNTAWTASFDSVTISAFKMGKYEVTQEQYQAVMGNNPSNFSSNPASGDVQGRRPVERVSWYDAIEFCNALSALEGLTPAYTIDKVNQDSNNTNSYDTVKWTVTLNSGSTGYRLPTEAQWQYAAQGGGSSTVTATDATAWYRNNSDSKTHEVGKKSANAYGLHDILGNVLELCWDWYESAYPSGSDTMGASSGNYRVIRGGCWKDWLDEGEATSAYRGYNTPDREVDRIGFRLVRP
jgi:formylglycine-generating enzyme required for sulfatase activity